MEHLLDMLLSGGLKLPFLTPDILALDQDLPKSDLLALLLLQKRGEATMSELAADLGAPLSTATGIGARLERKGFLERQRHPQDRRVILLRLTPKGQELAGRARDQVQQVIQRVQAVLSPEEVQQLLAMIQKVLAAFSAPTEAPASAPGKEVRRIPIE